jgi:hypothetical protein
VLSYAPDMEVFLIPVAADRYELYCEVPDDDSAAAVPPPRGFLRGLMFRFRESLAEVERERHRSPFEAATEAPDTKPWFTRLKRRVLCRIAETIAEQRLLWHLRRQTTAVAVHPEDMEPAAALRIVNASMQADFEKHRFWLAIDAVAFIISGLLVLLPGPNLVAYYFGFRLVGHYLSMRGARQALKVVQWKTEPSAPLRELRAAIALEPDERAARVTDIAAQLHLERLAAFFQRTAVPSA